MSAGQKSTVLDRIVLAAQPCPAATWHAYRPSPAKLSKLPRSCDVSLKMQNPALAAQGTIAMSRSWKRRECGNGDPYAGFQR